MRSSSALLGLAALCASTNALTITSPSAQSYWVQFTNNTIAWSSSAGDPETVSLQIINPTSKSFAGPFSIAEYVKTSLKFYDVTYVTLIELDGYQVQMIDPVNNTRVLATSGAFSVKIGGTTPAPVTFAPGTTGSNGGSNGTSSGGSNQSGITGGLLSNSTSTNHSGSNSSSFKNNGTANSNAKSFASHFEVPTLSVICLGLSSFWAIAV